MKLRVHPRIQKPCTKTWDSLSGNEQKRFCSECQHFVHNLDEMTDEERRQILRAPGRKCVAYRDNPDVRPLPIGVWLIVDRLRLVRPITALFAVVVALLGTGCATTNRKDNSNCPPTLADKTNAPEKIEDGKTFTTVGIIIEPPPCGNEFFISNKCLTKGTGAIMGFSLHIQRVDGQEGDLPVADLSSSMKMFEAIPWREEIARWEKLPDEERELRRPLFQAFDDSAHTLHITAYSDDLMGVAYNYPFPSSPFGVNYEVEEGYIGTDQYPRSGLRTLLGCFFTSDTQAMLSLLQSYSTSSNTEEP